MTSKVGTLNFKNPVVEICIIIYLKIIHQVYLDLLSINPILFLTLFSTYKTSFVPSSLPIMPTIRSLILSTIIQSHNMMISMTSSIFILRMHFFESIIAETVFLTLILPLLSLPPEKAFYVDVCIPSRVGNRAKPMSNQ